VTTGMSEQQAVDSVGMTFGTQEPDDLQKLIELVQKDVIAWRPDPGDYVAGTLRDVSESSEGDFGSYIILLIEKADGTLVQVHCFHTVLRRDIERRLQRGTLKTGDQIAILYVGESDNPGKGKSAANLYRVVVNRP
jgi:hypothetical protein